MLTKNLLTATELIPNAPHWMDLHNIEQISQENDQVQLHGAGEKTTLPNFTKNSKKHLLSEVSNVLGLQVENGCGQAPRAKIPH